MTGTRAKELRNEARKYYDSAKAIITEERTKEYELAALHLRMCLESLSYEKLDTYSDEINTEIFDTWQPRRVIARLTEADPLVQQDYKLFFGIQDSVKTPTPLELLKPLGHETPITMKTVRSQYDALGSYLHVPTLKQQRVKGPHDLEKLKSRCEKTIELIGKILTSTVWGSGFGDFQKFECARCKNETLFRLQEASEFKIRCFSCDAPHTVKNTGHDEPTQVLKHLQKVQCPNPECDYLHSLWEDEYVEGRAWECPACSKKMEVGFVVQLKN